MSSNKNIVASELASIGFVTRITETGVLVSLNQSVSKMEVETALEQTFGEIIFKVYPISLNQRHVITEESE